MIILILFGLIIFGNQMVSKLLESDVKPPPPAVVLPQPAPVKETKPVEEAVVLPVDRILPEEKTETATSAPDKSSSENKEKIFEIPLDSPILVQ